MSPTTDTQATLRAAAALLRQAGQVAEPGPWMTHPADMPGEVAVSHALPAGRPSPHRVATTGGLYCAEENAAWIALVSPVLAEPLATWLDDEASSSRIGFGSPSALTVARAILGGAR